MNLCKYCVNAATHRQVANAGPFCPEHWEMFKRVVRVFESDMRNIKAVEELRKA